MTQQRIGSVAAWMIKSINQLISHLFESGSKAYRMIARFLEHGATAGVLLEQVPTAWRQMQ